MEKCVACKHTIDAAEIMRCNPCRGAYHYKCLNMSAAAYTSHKKGSRPWHCPLCSNVNNRKRGDNTNTPVRGAPSATTEPGSSRDNASSARAPERAASPPAPSCETISLERLSALLDAKFDKFRQDFFKDITATVRHEVNEAVSDLRSEFTHTTDFISERQGALEAKLADATRAVSELSADRERLQADLGALRRRLDATEKISRSMNLEVQPVPERNNENVLGIVKKLFEVVKCPIADGEILACRRVAKLDPSSPRPRNILVTLGSPRLRDAALSAVKRYNKQAGAGAALHSAQLGVAGDARPVYVAEHLSPECKKLHAAARKLAKEKAYKFVWVRYGRVFVRKDDKSGAILINNTNNLNKIV